MRPDPIPTPAQMVKDKLTRLYTLHAIALDCIHQCTSQITRYGWYSYLAQLEETICDLESRSFHPVEGIK
jgi:hypothetical protein